MEITSLADLIGGLGFQIAICVYLIWDRTTLTREFIATLSANTAALSSLKDLIEHYHRKEE